MPSIGQFEWGIILCKFSDHPEEPCTRKGAEDLIAGRGLGSLRDYWTDMSYGNLDMSVLFVHGSITMPFPLDQGFRALGRFEKTQKCLEALPPFSFLATEGLILVINAVQDSGAAGKRILLDPGASPTSSTSRKVCARSRRRRRLHQTACARDCWTIRRNSRPDPRVTRRSSLRHFPRMTADSEAADKTRIYTESSRPPTKHDTRRSGGLRRAAHRLPLLRHLCHLRPIIRVSSAV